MKRLYNIFTLSFISLAALTMLGGCEGTKEQLGLTRTAPDEFAVVKRAPLEMPPDYNLRPPSPGARRPQEAHSGVEAQSAVFGSETQTTHTAPDNGESALLMQAGAGKAQTGIRAVVDHETTALEPDEKPVAERLIGWTSGGDELPPASVVDPKAEAERLKKNIDEGRPVTEGETPTIDE